MLASKRIPVTEAVWVEISDLKMAGQTYSQLLEEISKIGKRFDFSEIWKGLRKKASLWSFRGSLRTCHQEKGLGVPQRPAFKNLSDAFGYFHNPLDIFYYCDANRMAF